MKPNTALAIMLAGSSLTLLQRGRHPPSAGLAARLCATAAILIGLASISQDLLHVDFGIDELLITVPADDAMPPGGCRP